VADWLIKSVNINGGFIGGLALELPPCLTCIIGPRGSGKSTLAEAIRYCLLGTTGASKSRMELLQANLRGSIVTLHTVPDLGGNAYTIRRGFQQSPTITNSQGRVVAEVDLDRGTFLPLDAYGTAEIELLADESLGDKRRTLLDELIASDLQQVQLTLNEQRRQLEANADAIRTTQRAIADFTEQIEEIGDARARLAALPPAPPGAESGNLLLASKQQQANERETQSLARALAHLKSWRQDLKESLAAARSQLTQSLQVTDSENKLLLASAEQILIDCIVACEGHLARCDQEIARAEGALHSIQAQLGSVHADQQAAFDKLQSENQVAGEAVRERAQREKDVATLGDREQKRTQMKERLAVFFRQRDDLKAEFLLQREKISQLRSSVAKRLQAAAGDKVRIRVLENADQYAYRQMLTDGLRGARVRNHEDILVQLLCLRPEHLAQLVRDNDVEEFDAHTTVGKERAIKILDAFHQNLDVFSLETASIDDQVKIELNVSAQNGPHFKDASELSRGQRCTALLPLLLARQTAPLIIDQPEDNLDNHFIYETIVESIKRLKPNRQMIFITHNANIPVLGDADLVVVLNSDGKKGFIEKSGSLDDCRAEIIDLLEGGEEAFEQRRKRYAK